MSVRETPEQVDRRRALEGKCQKMAQAIATAVDDSGVGFALFLFHYGPDGALAYVSSADRQDVAKMFREWLSRAEAGTS